ncbi:MAG: 2-phospho-L-lactate guanylyltransferase [Sphingomonadales bacterium]|nr:2-phospho-L-lactate guanylyltransferase [Sphingomonadales bacterium]
MTCWAIIPAKHPADAKSRLAGVLDEAARHRLARAMLDHVLATVAAAPGIDRIAVVAAPDLPLPAFSTRLPDPGTGLNPAIAAGFAHAAAHGATRAVILHGDLPRLEPRDVALLAALPEATMAIAPDRHDTGTNALSLPLPHANRFTFAFGPGSFAAHERESVKLRLDCEIMHTPGLARDIDEPADLRDARGLDWD